MTLVSSHGVRAPMGKHAKPSPAYVIVNLRVPLHLARAIDQLHAVESAKHVTTPISRFAHTTVSKHAMYVAALELGVPALVSEAPGTTTQPCGYSCTAIYQPPSRESQRGARGAGPPRRRG